MTLPHGTVGIDVGATLSKLVFEPDGPGPSGGAVPSGSLEPSEGFVQVRFPSADLDAVRGQIARWRPERIAATGGGAEPLLRVLSATPGTGPEPQIVRVDEFAAWATGAPLLAARAAIPLPASYLLVSLGTGTSVLAVRDGEAMRVGGTALGGGTLLGLGSLLAGSESFADLARLAAKGDRRKVDLLVGDIYRQGGISLPAELNAASFGKLASRRPADLAHALMGLVGENIAIIATALARAHDAERILYCGSTLDSNPALEAILTTTTETFGGFPLYLPHGAFCGAIGAAALVCAAQSVG